MQIIAFRSELWSWRVASGAAAPPALSGGGPGLGGNFVATPIPRPAVATFFALTSNFVATAADLAAPATFFSLR